MLNLVLWFFVFAPAAFALEYVDYLKTGLVKGWSKQRWHLEKEIKKMQSMLDYLQQSAKDDPNFAHIYALGIEEIESELNVLKAKR